MQELTITCPDDFHVHFRDGDEMKSVVHHTARQFRRALVMPNLQPPITTVSQAGEYWKRIMECIPPGYSFTPIMTLYLTDDTSPEEIHRAVKSGFIGAIKLYPAGATTNSHQGVTHIEKVYPVLERMEELGRIILSIHGEVADPRVDIFDREAVFIDKVLDPLILRRFPRLNIVLEHVTTAHGVGFVSNVGDNIAATITVHHLLANRNDMLAQGIRPHYYCKPIPKREKDQRALLAAAISDKKFFLGTDSAPHARGAKESDCGCAGCFTAHSAIELCATAFEKVNSLDKLEKFISLNGAKFYGLPKNTETITLVRDEKGWVIPKTYPFGNTVVVPFWAEETLHWSVK